VEADNGPFAGARKRTASLGTIGARSLNRLQVLIINVPGEVLAVEH
jgi:hypothetical protein